MINPDTSFHPIFRLLPQKIALIESDLNRLVEQILEDALHVNGTAYYMSCIGLAVDIDTPNMNQIKKSVLRWCSSWRGHPRKTEVFYIIIPVKGATELEDVVQFAEDFEILAFGYKGAFAFRDTLLSIKKNSAQYDIHLLINRHNGNDLLSFHSKGPYTFEKARELLELAAQGIGISSGIMKPTETKFTMGFREAMAKGIDYRNFERVKQLPPNTKIVAIAGIWGDSQNMRCLFETTNGQKIRRDVFFQNGYEIPELGCSAKELLPGQDYTVSAASG